MQFLGPWVALAIAAVGVPPGELDRRAREDGIVLLPGDPPAHWAGALADDVRAALSRLPAPMRRFPGGPLIVELHARAMPFGMGDGSDAAPEWTEGRRRFHLYAVGASDEGHAGRRLRVLDGEAQERLWRQRAIVHAVVARWDEALGLSRRRAWRRLDAWIRPHERPLAFRERSLNTFSGAFSRERGRASAALDLATFAEERFVPVEALAPGALPADETVPCREPSKTRVLDALLAEAGLLDGPAPETGACPAFDAWAELDLLRDIEVLLVSASGRRPESLFGHVLLRPVHGGGERLRGPGFETAVEIVALTGGAGDGPAHLLRGLLGGYSTVVGAIPLGDFERETLTVDQRTVRRFRLDLSPSERRQVLQRVWELEGRGYFDYRFFTDNCASVLALLLEGALPGEVELGGGWRLFASPTGTLDDLAAATLRRVAPDGAVTERPLLVAVPGDLVPSGERARRADEGRAASEVAVLTGAGTTREPFARAFRAAHAADPQERRAGFEAIAALTAGPGAYRSREALYDWWERTVQVERYRLDAAQNERRWREAAAYPRRRRDVAAVRAELAARQARFEVGLPAPEGDAEPDTPGAAGDPTREGERLRASRQRAEAEESVFRRLTDLQGSLVAGVFADLDPRAWLARDEREQVAEQAAAMAGALPGSGLWRVAVAPGARAMSDGEGGRPSLVLSAAMLAEPLGERRLRGLRADAGTRLLDGWVELVQGRGPPSVERAALTLFALRTLWREPPALRQGLLDHLGWGLDLGWDRWPGRSMEQRAALAADLLGVLQEGRGLRDHTLLGFGAAVVAGWGAAVLGAGPRFSFTHRSGLGRGADALVVEAVWTAIIEVRSRLEQEARLAAGVSLIVGDPMRRAVIVRPELQLEAAWGVRSVQRAGLALRLEPL